MIQPSASIFIDGKPLPTFKEFTLEQSMYAHHQFELVVGHSVVEELGSHTLDKSKSWIGKILEASFGDNQFLGVITSINMVHFHGFYGDLVIRGESPTILLDGGEHKRSWLKKSLKDIVGDTASDAGVKIVTDPEHGAQVDFMVQYRESHFEFLKRLAATYQEWFFYDGTKIHFGQPADLPKVPVVYGVDLENIEVSMQLKPVSLSGYSYHSEQDTTHTAEAPGSVDGTNNLGQEAMSASVETFQSPAKTSVTPRINDKARLEEVLKKRQAAKAADLSMIKGKGTKLELRPGVIAEISSAIHDDGQWKTETYGEYLITSVKHVLTDNNEYRNEFEGIPGGIKTLPEPDFRMPVAEPQIAEVKSNTDPKNMGRVQVKFLWQEDSDLSPFLRVMSLDAGKSDKVAKNRGLVFIPEVGDYVMVGFRYHDPMRPFVMGSVYNGLTGGGGGEANQTKSIITRSGVTISIDDDAEKGSITISDPSENKIVLDGKGDIIISGKSNIYLSAAETIGLSAKNIAIDAGDKILAGATNLVDINIKGEEAPGIELKQDKTVTVDGKEINVLAKSTLNLDAETTTMNGSKQTNIQGMLVNIN